MRVGILGYGKIGKIREESIKQLIPNPTFTIYDPVYENSVSTYKDVISNSDVIVICATNDMNVEYTVEALKAGKHVFCEKPPARNYEELLQVDKCFKKTDRLSLIYGFNHRQYDSIKKMKSLIDSKEMGNILWMRGRYGKAMGDPNTQGWRADPEKSGGGILLDQGIHMLDLMSFFGGKFDVIQGIITNNMWNVEGIEDNAFVQMYNSKDKIAASLHSTMIEWRHVFSLEVLLETGYMALNGLKTPSGSYGKEVLTICGDKRKEYNTSTEIEFTVNNTWKSEMKLFIDSIIVRDGKTNLPDALEVMRIIKDAYNGKY